MGVEPTCKPPDNFELVSPRLSFHAQTRRKPPSVAASNFAGVGGDFLRLYPINLDVVGKRCTVVGGGQVALRKIRTLAAAGAVIGVIAPEICAGVSELAESGEIFWRRAEFSADMLTDEVLVIAATDSADVNRLVSEAARVKKILVNVVNAEGSDFFVPSRISRGELLLTISTGANSPAFAKFLRRMLEAELGENFGAGLELIARRRREVKRLLPDARAREDFWRRFLTAEVWRLLKSGQLDELEASINHALAALKAAEQLSRPTR